MEEIVNSEQMNFGEMGHELTLRMISVVEELKDKYAALYNTRDFISKINYLNRCKPDEVGSVQAELIYMFGRCGINDVKTGQPPSYYAVVLKESNIPDPKEMKHQVYESFFREFVENPYPLPEEYIERIVNGKISPEWNQDTLRLKILKVFLRDAAALEGAGYKSLYLKQFVKKKTEMKNLLAQDIIRYLDDSIFDVLKNADHQQCRKSGRFGLLKISDDLAHGKFGNANVVREEIYLFAIVFELMYFTGNQEEIVTEEDKARDIEKVMFGDYYANNIMRYISAGHEYIKSGGEQQNPTGKGINYKNYMEAIFLYFLRRWDMGIEEKIFEIYKMADEVYIGFKERKEHSLYSENDILNKTQYYKDVFRESVLETKEEFKEFLISNYDCSLPPETTPVFSIEAEQNTALEEYMKLIEDADDYGVWDENFEKWTLAFLTDEMDVDRIKEIHDNQKKGEVDFANIDDKTKFDLLLYEVNKDICKKKSKSELDRKIISRSDILRLFYQLYINMNDIDYYGTINSFSEVYDDFSDLANQHLRNALLRPINGRDLYDLILIYSAYCNINDDKFDKGV